MLVPMRGVKLYANLWHFQGLTIKVFKKFIFLMDTSQEIDPESQDEIPELPSHDKKTRMLRSRTLFKEISVVGVYRAAIPSEKFSSECLAVIEVSD